MKIAPKFVTLLTLLFGLGTWIPLLSEDIWKMTFWEYVINITEYVTLQCLPYNSGCHTYSPKTIII